MSRASTLSDRKLVPLVKWPGGKRWLLKRYPGLFESSKYRRYFEPFLGGAAAFAAIKPEDAVLSDSNAQLINLYRAIRDNPHGLLREMASHQEAHSRLHYYRVRKDVPRCPTSAAARFLYLNRTCFNGIYRVNKLGQFNVPMGSRSSVLFADDDFHGWSALLSRAELRVADFEATIRMASQGDLVFADPPYVLKHNHNGFRKYNESIFSWQDQLRLAEVLNSAARRGVNVVLTNANHASVSELYSDQFRRVAVSRGSMVAASRHKRGSYEELLFWTEGAINEFILQER